MRVIVAFVAAIAFARGQPADAQNDWQYPDPYFGILEVEKSLPERAGPKVSEHVRRAPAATRPRPGWRLLRSPPRTAARARIQPPATEATAR